MFENLKKDAQRYYVIEGGEKSPSFFLKTRIVLESYGLHVVAVYRYGNWIKQLDVPNFFSVIKDVLMFSYNNLNYLMTKMYGISISCDASIGAGFYVGHFGGISIGDCNIGENCSVHQQTIIGRTFTGQKDMQPPAIGNNVWIGAHVIIENHVSIGDNAAIAAGAVVKQSVEEKCLVSGNPARVINKNYDAIALLGNSEKKPL